MDKGALGGLVPASAGTVFVPQPDSNAISERWRTAQRRLLAKAAAVTGAAAAGIAVRRAVFGQGASGRPERRVR